MPQRLPLPEDTPLYQIRVEIAQQYISTTNAPMSISVIVPAYNEERYIGETLNHLNRAKDYLLKRKGMSTEISRTQQALAADSVERSGY